MNDTRERFGEAREAREREGCSKGTMTWASSSGVAVDAVVVLLLRVKFAPSTDGFLQVNGGYSWATHCSCCSSLRSFIDWFLLLVACLPWCLSRVSC